MFKHIHYSKLPKILSLILCGSNSVSKISKFLLGKIDEVDRKAYLEMNWRTKKNTEAEDNSQKQSEGNWRMHKTEDLKPGYPTVPRMRNSVGPMRHPLRSSSFHSHHHQQSGALSTTATMADQPSREERQEQAWKHNHPIENSHIVGVPALNPPDANQDRGITVASSCNGAIMCSKLNRSKETADDMCRTLSPAASLQPRQESVETNARDLLPLGFSYAELNRSSVIEPSQETLSKDVPFIDTKERDDIPSTTLDDNIGEVEYPITLLPLNKPLDIKVARVLSPSMFVCKVLSAWTPALQEVMENAQGTYNRYRKFHSLHLYSNLQLLPTVISEL